MKKLALLYFAFLLISQLAVADEAQPITSKIKKVTVFKKGAQITREAKATLPAGRSQLKFIRISPDIDKNSIQVKADGDFTLLSVQHQLNYLEVPSQSDSIMQLEGQQKDLNIRISEFHALIEVYKEEESLLQVNKSIGGQQNGVSIQELTAAADFYRSRLKEIKLEKLRLNRAIAELKKERETITKQMSVLRSKRGTYSSEIVLTINAEKAGSVQLSLSYAINNAGWYPTYDLRVKDIASPVMLTYKASVYQTSGEDWNNVQLTLSTGNPSQSGVKPELQPWRLGFYNPAYAARVQQRYNSGAYNGVNQLGATTINGTIVDEYGEPLIGANVLIKGTNEGAVTNFEGQFSIPIGSNSNARELIVSYTGYTTLETQITSSNMNIVLAESSVSLEEVVVTGYNRRAAKRDRKARKKKQEASKPVPTTTVENTTTVEFEIELPYTILTDGKQNTVYINEHQLQTSYEYYCAPKLDPDAFLTAQVTDWESYNLLNGSANLFFEGTFVGKSYLDVLNTEDTLDISLGRDQNIVVERTRQKEFSKKQFIGNKKTESRAWKLQVRNKKSYAVNLIIMDQIPISTTQEIEVKHEIGQNGRLEKETGFIEWELQLPAGEKRELDFQYSVKYPKKKRVMLE